MNGQLFPTCRSAVAVLSGGVRLGWLLVAFWLFTLRSIFGADIEWTGTTNSTWSVGTNWNGGTRPGNTDNAKFDLSFGNQPNLAANASVGGIWMATGVAQNVTLSGSGFTLTLNGNTINGTPGLGILIDNTSAYTLTISAGLKVGSNQTWLNNSGNLFTVSGTVNTNNKALTIDGSGNTTISNVISSNGTITKQGNGTLTLSGANTYGGATTLTAGTLNINNATALGTNAFTLNGGTIDNTTAGAITMTNNNAITFGGNFTFGGTQNLTFGTGAVTNAGNRTITLNGTNSALAFGGTMTNTSGAAQTTTVNGAGNTLSLGGYALSNNATSQVDVINGNGNVTITGAITNGGTATASGLTYSGSGTLTLSGTNTYKGATTVNSGTLLVNGNNSSATGAVSVNNSGTILGGTGTIGGAVTVGNGAILLGGTGSAASGTLTLANNLTLNSGSIIELALGASGAHSTLARTGGTWNFNSTQAFTFINLGATEHTTYNNIITGLTSDPGTESNWTITNTGWIGTFNYSSGNINLNLVVVPEPATYVAGFLAIVALGYCQRRRLYSLLRRPL